MPKPSSGSGGGWVIAGLAALGLIAVSQCLTNNGNQNVAEASRESTEDAIANSVAAQPPAPVRPLDLSSAKRGMAHVSLAAREGLAGEMIYSQNCFDALSRHFSWAKLDRCGAFDAEAVAALGDAKTTGLDKEATWFDSEAAAGRYLKAAISAGQEAAAADERLAALQRRAAAHHPVKSESAVSEPISEAAALPTADEEVANILSGLPDRGPPN